MLVLLVELGFGPSSHHGETNRLLLESYGQRNSYSWTNPKLVAYISSYRNTKKSSEAFP